MNIVRIRFRCFFTVDKIGILLLVVASVGHANGNSTTDGNGGNGKIV